ncbi:GL20719 [Drosophila persimilis]|uniref:GL20719 n=1 Tax=Drosophila persimilis TaxID=7234 RepID=B4H484_DROPE|nr:GL20719 [Drosophila persimilis]
MAQLENVGQGRHAVVGPMLASAMLLVGLLFALLGIKIWGFRRRLTFDRSGGSSRSSPAQAQQAPPRYAAQESQVNGTDNAVHGVFRQRNLEEFESSWPSSTSTGKDCEIVRLFPRTNCHSIPFHSSTVNSYLAGSVPNLRMGEPAEVLYRAPPQTQRRRRKESVEPPPYDPGPPYLPDYESLMQLEDSRASHTLPKYTEAVGGERFVSSIEDLYAELETNGSTGPSSSEAPTNGIDNFEELCQEMAVAVTVAEAPRPAPQPAPRSTKTSTLNVRGDAAPLPCYHPEELPGSSSSEDEVPSAPRPAQRNPRTLKVRFDVENLQYYQSAEVVASSSGESEEDRPPPRPMMRSTIFEPEPEPGPGHNSVPSLFGAQVSQDDSSDDEAFGRAISQHRTMTAALRTMQNDTDA